MFSVYLYKSDLSVDDLQLCLKHSLDVMVKPGEAAGVLEASNVTSFLSDFSSKLISISKDTLIIGSTIQENPTTISGYMLVDKHTSELSPNECCSEYGRYYIWVPENEGDAKCVEIFK